VPCRAEDGPNLGSAFRHPLDAQHLHARRSRGANRCDQRAAGVGGPADEARVKSGKTTRRVATCGEVRRFFCAKPPRGKIVETNGQSAGTFPAQGASKTEVFCRKALVFKGFASRKASVFLSENPLDAETDAPSLRSRKNREEMVKPNGAVPALPHLSKN